MALVICSPMANGMSSTRAESFTAALALMEPYVTIWATYSLPYFSVT